MTTIYQQAFRNARLLQKKSLSEFAPILAVNKSHISKIENGFKKPSIALMKRLEIITGLHFWALVAGDFAIENQQKYAKISIINYEDIKIDYHKLSESDKNYLCSRFEVEIRKFEKQIEKTKYKLAKQLKKLSLNKNVLAEMEQNIKSGKMNLEFLMQSDAPATLIAHQKSYVEKVEADLEAKKSKIGIRSGVEHILMQVMIEELEMKVKLREDKILKIKSTV